MPTVRTAPTSSASPWAGPSRDDDFSGTELFAIYLLSEFYGSGAGQALLDAAIGNQAAILWVAEDNPRAQRFYERNGFRADGRRKVEPRLENLVEIRMSRDEQ